MSNLVRPVDAFSHVDRGLFLPRQALSEEVPISSLLERVVGLNIEQFADAVPDAISVRNGIEIGPRISRLRGNPFSRAW